MKNIFLTVIALGFFQTAHAGLTIPYKTIEIDCRNANGSLKLAWDFSKSPMINEILVNGSNEISGSRMSVENGTTIYFKDSVFSISLTKEDDKKQVTKDIMLLGKNETVLCTQSSSWHVTE
ncbi:MAG: hypothetical protein ACXWRE_14655 [Pseudobdellovibrionaceae bacterium]